MLAAQLARRCESVIGIDLDPDVLQNGSDLRPANLTLVQGDVLTYPLPVAGFDFISAVATLHHLPLEAGLQRLRDLLRPGGVLAVIGLYRAEGVVDGLYAAAALPTSRILRVVRGYTDGQVRLQQPEETLPAIRKAAEALLPGARVRRQLLFRYSLVWRKPPRGG